MSKVNNQVYLLVQKTLCFQSSLRKKNNYLVDSYRNVAKIRIEIMQSEI
jgi:hypothetical protein